MNRPDAIATGSPPGAGGQLGRPIQPSSADSPARGTAAAPSQGLNTAEKPRGIRVAKHRVFSLVAGKQTEFEVFALSVGEETIELLPFKIWSQLDHFKWTARGWLPGDPPGLEVGVDHIRLTGKRIATSDPAGCDQLERLFAEWLALEQDRGKPRQSWAVPTAPAAPTDTHIRYHVEVDKRGQVHIHCLRGKETLATIGLAPAGFNSLCQQGLMKKIHKLSAGVLHDWVELDDELFSFEKGRNDATRLEQVLNERFAPVSGAIGANEISVLLNPASPTGFDLQFRAHVAGVLGVHRYHLSDEALELLQDPIHCGLLQPGLMVRLTPPYLTFKQKTADGGEQHLRVCPETTLNLQDEDGIPKTIDLSQSLYFTRLSPHELTAVFNHPAINRHAAAVPPAQAGHPAPTVGEPPRPQAPAAPVAASPAKAHPLPDAPRPVIEPTQPKLSGGSSPPLIGPATVQPGTRPTPASASRTSRAGAHPKPTPNLWLRGILDQPAVRHDFFASLVYYRLAERFGNSSEGKFGPAACWYIALGEVDDFDHPAFKGVFLTQRRGLGFRTEGQMVRFYNEIVFLGPQQYTLEGIGIRLLAVGLDARERFVFILSDGYRAKFGVPDATLTEVLDRLSEFGAVVLSVSEVLASAEPLTVLWTAPADQVNPDQPEAREHLPRTDDSAVPGEA